MFRFSIVMSCSFLGSYGLNIVVHTLEVQATIKEWIFFGFLHRFFETRCHQRFFSDGPKNLSSSYGQNRIVDFMTRWMGWTKLRSDHSRIAWFPSTIDGDRWWLLKWLYFNPYLFCKGARYEPLGVGFPGSEGPDKNLPKGIRCKATK